jgi:peptidylprolyl isomerase
MYVSCITFHTLPGKTHEIEERLLMLHHETSNTSDTVRVHYRGKLHDGSVFDASFDREPLEFTIGGGQVIPGFEEAVVGVSPGDSKTTELPVEKGFGPHRKNMVAVANKSQFVGRWHLEPIVGQRVQVPQPDGPPR